MKLRGRNLLAADLDGRCILHCAPDVQARRSSQPGAAGFELNRNVNDAGSRKQQQLAPEGIGIPPQLPGLDDRGAETGNLNRKPGDKTRG
jgi:hypothetical protein